MSSLNWGQLLKDSGGAFEPLPPSDYDCVIVESSAVQASTGKPMFKVKFKVIAGPHSGRTFWNNFVITAENPNAMAMFFTHMKAMGLDSNYFAGNPSNEQVAAALNGRPAKVKLGTRVWQGQNRNEVKGVLPATVAAPTGGVPAAAPPPPVAQIPAPQVAPPAPAPAPAPTEAEPPPVPNVPF